MGRNSFVICAGAVALVFGILGGCADSDDGAMDLIKWSQRNPPVSDDTWRGVERLTCKPLKLDICNNEACRSIDVPANPPITVTWRPVDGHFERCDKKGCDKYRPQVSYSGSFANIVAPENAMIFRLTASGEYRELLNLATETYVYRGHCVRG